MIYSTHTYKYTQAHKAHMGWTNSCTHVYAPILVHSYCLCTHVYIHNTPPCIGIYISMHVYKHVSTCVHIHKCLYACSLGYMHHTAIPAHQICLPLHIYAHTWLHMCSKDRDSMQPPSSPLCCLWSQAALHLQEMRPPVWWVWEALLSLKHLFPLGAPSLADQTSGRVQLWYWPFLWHLLGPPRIWR